LKSVGNKQNSSLKYLRKIWYLVSYNFFVSGGYQSRRRTICPPLGIVFSTFWSQKSISEKLFSKHDKWTAAVLNINSASKVFEKNAFFVIKMASESHIKTIQQLTCFVKNNRVQSIFFTSDIVLTSFSHVLFMPALENNLKLKKHYGTSDKNKKFTHTSSV
jgi:hypothetical protein